MDSRWRELIFFLEEGHTIRHLINRYKWYHYPKKNIVAPFPLHVDIEASSKCNMNCPMCFRDRLDIEETVMDFDLYCKIIDECAKHRLYSIKLSWRGDPLLNPDIAMMVEYAKKKKIPEVAFLTNGLALTKEMSQSLVAAKLDWITISFDGVGKTYEAIRKPAKFGEAIERIKFLKELRDWEFKKTWPNPFVYKRPQIKVQTIWSAIKDNPKIYKTIWKNIADKILFIPDKDFYSEIIHDPKFVCQYPWQRITITASGLVTTCIGDTNEQNILGDVNKQTIKEIWHGEKMQDVRKRHSEHNRLSLSCCKECPEGRIYTLKKGEKISKDFGNLRGI